MPNILTSTLGKVFVENFTKNNMYYGDSGQLTSQMDDAKMKSGHFGGVFSPGTTEATCRYPGPGLPSAGFAYDEGVKQMNNQIAANRHRPAARGCNARFVRHGGQFQPSVREGYTEAPKSFTRTNAALINGYRSCRFNQASGF